MSRQSLWLALAFLAPLACKQSAPPADAPKPAPVAPAPAAPAPAAAPLTFGVVMPLGLQASEQTAALVSDYFSNALKQPVQTRLFTYEELADALAQGTVDVGYISPLVYVKAAKRAPMTLVRKALHRETPSYLSIIFVKKDSAAKELKSLEKKRIAWVQKGSASGNFIPRAMLAKQHIDASKFFAEQLYMQDHGKVCEAVYEGKVDAGASFADMKPDGTRPPDDQLTVDGCRTALGDDKIKDLRILYTSEPIPNDVLVVRSGLPASLAEKIGTVLDQLPSTHQGSEVLHNGFHADGFVKGSEADFTNIRALVDSFPDE